MDNFRQRVNSVYDTDAASSRPLLLGREAELGALPRTGRFRIATGAFFLLLCALLTLSIFFTPAVKVYRDGEYVGTLAGAGQLKEAVSLLENHVGDILGREYTLDAELTTELTVVRQSEVDSIGAVRAALYRDVDEVVTNYALYAGGELVGMADTPVRLQAIMNLLESKYAAQGQMETAVSETYSIVYTTIPSDTTTNAAEILNAADSQIDFITVSQSSYTVEIPYQTEYILDEELYVGESSTVTEGCSGELLVHTQIRRLDGEVESMRVLSSEVSAEPVTEVIALGAKYRPETASYGEYIWPVQGVISSYFGLRSMGNHEGLDICNALDSSIVAADGGEVTFAGEYYGYGNLVVITHDDGTQTLYGHLNAILVEAGTRVFRGQEIGLMGTTGRSTGVHLHFEMQKDGVSVDPMEYLPAL